MTFDVYMPFQDKNGVIKPGVCPRSHTWDQVLALCRTPEQKERINKVRNAQSKEEIAEAKKMLPAICFVGSSSKTRANTYMTPTGFVMIDIDHCENPQEAWATISEEMGAEWVVYNVLCAHVTVGGKGLRVVFKGQQSMASLRENMEWFDKKFECSRFGKFDAPCKDFARLSFLPLDTDFLFQNLSLTSKNPTEIEHSLVNEYMGAVPEKKQGELFAEDETIDNFTEKEVQEFEAYEYRGTLIKTIIEKWIEQQGKPEKGEVHNYYNEMVKNFRNIVSNNGRALLYLLPRFGHSASECWSQIQSITRVATLSQLPRPFYFFLKDNGYYKPRVAQTGSLAEYMMSEGAEPEEDKIPWLPPVFREYIRITPKDFRVSVVNALLPIMGTLTSYLQAPYYYDGRMHTTSFFSIIYAPAGTGKGFVERMMHLLFEKLRSRDYVQQARESIYLEKINRKGDNEKAPERPKTSLRIIPPKNSESEFLQKQQDNCGYHMFTYAAEMDSWAKGVKAAGGNKDDMIRVAWDNGEYGQQFKSSSTFKGTVNLFWNVLITGTIQQLFAYFKNVENGLITRCSFTTIENQEFAPAPIWKQLNAKDIKMIRKFMDRCDAHTYVEPCDLLPADVDIVSADKFDEEINWHFAFRDREVVNMDWLRNSIDTFLNKHREKAALDLDKARDVFRRRVAVRGFRLGLMCYALWDRPRFSDLQKCIPFIEWWMEQDLESSLRLWGNRYNTETEDVPNLNQRSIFSQLPKVFKREDVYALCIRQGIKSPVRQIIYQWLRMGYVVKNGKDEWEKKDKK